MTLKNRSRSTKIKSVRLRGVVNDHVRYRPPTLKNHGCTAHTPLKNGKNDMFKPLVTLKIGQGQLKSTQHPSWGLLITMSDTVLQRSKKVCDIAEMELFSCDQAAL